MAKTILITGGTSGIGLAAARAFAAENYHVVVISRSQDKVDKTVSDIGNIVAPYDASGRISGYSADITDAARLMDVAEQVEADTGKLDALFANAGIARFAPILETGSDVMEAILGTNVMGTFNTLKAFAPLVRDGGSIVVTTSINKDVGMPMSGAYAASKAAAAALVRVMAAELVGRRVRVNAVSPGPVDTPIYGKLGLPEEQVEAFAEDMALRIPMGCFAKPEEIAEVVRFLASDRSAFMTGEEITVDGGWTSIGPVSLQGE